MINCTFEDNGQAKLRHVTCSVMVLNKTKDQILLIKRAANSFTCPNLWAHPGGFMDQGEYLAEAAVRETFEETGYQCQVEKLFRINDNPIRPKEDRANVDFVFIAIAGEKIGQSDSEVSEAKWFKMGKVPKESQWAFDHYEDYLLLLKYLKTPFSLPLIGKIKL